MSIVSSSNILDLRLRKRSPTSPKKRGRPTSSENRSRLTLPKKRSRLTSLKKRSIPTSSNSSSAPSSTTLVTPMPAAANYGRYDKKQYCFYCKKPFSKLARHLESAHKREPDVAKAFSYDKKSQERRKLLHLLKKRGNFAHNAVIAANGVGELVACRRPARSKPSQHYTHCIHCEGLYARKSLWRHVRYCPQKPEDSNSIAGRKRVLSLNQTRLPPPAAVSDIVWKIACEMNNDEISSVVRSDQHILLLGQLLHNSKKSYARRHDYIRQKMRQMARLLIKARTMSPLRNVKEFVVPANFPHVIQCVRAVAGYNEENNSYGTASLALKLGHSLRKVADIVLCSAIVAERYDVAESTKYFITLHEKMWNESISAAALGTLHEAKWNKPQILPFTEDVKKLHSFLDGEQRKYMSVLQEEPNPKHYACLTKVTLTQVVLFNRKREGEVSRMELTSYTSRDKTEMNPDILVGLTDLEKMLIEHFESTVIRGKRSRKVPVMFTPVMIAAMDLLVRKREECQVPHENMYMFARPATYSSYRGSDCFREHAKQCGAKSPEALTSTKLRKQLATLWAVLNLKENKLDLLANFLGHDIRVHREYYHLTESTLQLAKVSKLLLAMERGMLPELKGKGLDDIKIDPEG